MRENLLFPGQAFVDAARAGPLSCWTPWLTDGERFTQLQRHGDLPRWLDALDALPDVQLESCNLNQPAVTLVGSATPDQQSQLRTALSGLHPWRKGPFNLFGVEIDTEWRSDLKWERIVPALDVLSDRCVLDIGCGSGYHLWRMLGAGAGCVLGIDPTVLFNLQFAAVRRYLPNQPVAMLPVGLEHLPQALSGFDTVFSMGILYHRRSPLDHLQQIRSLLRPGGQAVIETLVVEGNVQTLLMPPGRYAKMRNVWFIPSTDLLDLWLTRCGFNDVALVDVSATTVEEQRSTPWMTFDSLATFLDPEDPSRTVEGHPAPLRASFVARA